MKSSSDVIIIGAGIIGCSIAYRLAKAGLKVTVIERNQPGQEASWAAAGMLAPNAEVMHSTPPALTELLAASHAIYPDFVRELENETGMEIGFESTGSVVVAKDYEEARVLAGLFERQIEKGIEVQELSSKKLHVLEPDLAETTHVGLFFPRDYFVNSRNLVAALVKAAVENGANFLNNMPVTKLEFENNVIKGVRVRGEVISGGTVINSAGCWAGSVRSRNQISLPVRPIRGQIVELANKPQSLCHLIHSTGCYIVPWPDGRVLVGSTLENVGFNKEVTGEGVQQLLSAAIQIIPKLASAPIKAFWAGLRPDTPDNLPILGKIQFSNYIIATGHFRNGILLAPITAELISDLVISGKTSFSLEPFRPERFIDG